MKKQIIVKKLLLSLYVYKLVDKESIIHFFTICTVFITLVFVIPICLFHYVITCTDLVMVILAVTIKRLIQTNQRVSTIEHIQFLTFLSYIWREYENCPICFAPRIVSLCNIVDSCRNLSITEYIQLEHTYIIINYSSRVQACGARLYS